MWQTWVWASSSFEGVVTIHCLAALDLVVGFEQPMDCLIIQNHQAVQFMGRSMDWTLEDNMVAGVFFCATLTNTAAHLCLQYVHHFELRQ